MILIVAAAVSCQYWRFMYLSITAENWESISQAWIEVCSSWNVRVELDDEIFKVVRITSLLFSFIIVLIG